MYQAHQAAIHELRVDASLVEEGVLRQAETLDGVAVCPGNPEAASADTYTFA